MLRAKLENVRVYVETGMYAKADAVLREIESSLRGDPEVERLRRIIDERLKGAKAPSAEEVKRAAARWASDPSDAEAYSVLESAGEAGAAEIAALLSPEHPDAVRKGAAKLLALHPSAQAAEPMLEALDDPSPDVVYYVHEALCRLTGKREDMLLTKEGLPDGRGLRRMWKRKLAEHGLIESSKAAITLAPSPSPSPATAQTACRTRPPRKQHPPRISRSPAISARPRPTVAPPVRPSPTPRRTLAKTAGKRSRPPRTPTRSKRRGKKTRPPVGGPQIRR